MARDGRKGFRVRINKYHIQVLVVEASILLLAGLITFVVLWARTVRQRDRAEEFLQEVTKLEVGKSTFLEAQLLTRKYGGIPWYTTSEDMRCTFQWCELRFVFENRPLTSARLVRYVELIGTVSVKDGVVWGREIDYGRENGRVHQSEYDVIERPLWREDRLSHGQHERGLWRLKVDASGIPSVVVVRLGLSSSADQRKRAYSFDLSCLAKLWGCDSPPAMFPPDIPYRGTPGQTYSDTW
jgi:hypothetical protein